MKHITLLLLSIPFANYSMEKESQKETPSAQEKVKQYPIAGTTSFLATFGYTKEVDGKNVRLIPTYNE